MTTPQVRPARAEYAAADAEVLPVDAQTTTLAPVSTALVMAIVMPRSLKEPVGFAPSTFSQMSRSSSAESRSARTSGVPPSSSVMTGVESVTGRCSRYASIRPGQGAFSAFTATFRLAGLVAHDPQDRADPVDGLHVAQRVDRRPQVGLPGLVGDEDDARVVADADLLHGLDRHIVL